MSELTPKQEKRYYVYKLVDPRTDWVFYVGKGTKKRAYQHEHDARAQRNLNPIKELRIRQILTSGYRPRIDIVLETESESEAYVAERQLIAKIGIENLTNHTKGNQPHGIKTYLIGFNFMWGLAGAIVSGRLTPEKQLIAEQLVQEMMEALRLCVEIVGFNAIDRYLSKIDAGVPNAEA